MPPMAMNNCPPAQPTSVSMIRECKNNTTCFINGSLVTDIELIAQTGLALAEL